MAEATTLDVKLALVCETAGLGVMADILSVVQDREDVPAGRLARLTPDDVTFLYDTFIAPAIDRVERHLLVHGEEG